MKVATRPAPHNKTRVQVDMTYSCNDPRSSKPKPLRIQRTAPKGLSFLEAEEWGKKHADQFLAEIFGEVGKKEEVPAAPAAPPTPQPAKPAKPVPSVEAETSTSAPTLSEVYHDLMDSYVSGQSPVTQYNWSWIWRTLLEPKFGQARVDTFTRKSILAYRTELRKTYAITTVNEIIAKLKRILNWAAEGGHIAAAPKIKAIPEEEAAEKESYTDEEIAALLDAAEGNERATLVLLLTLDAGLRRNELIALRWGDIDFDREAIHIRHSIWRGKLKDPKGKKAIWVPMRSRLQHALARAKGTRSRNDFVFQGARNAWTSENALRDCMLPVFEAAGVQWKGFHKAKHSLVSILFEKGASLQEMQLLARHKHASTTQRYMHVRGAMDTMKSGLARLDDAPPVKRRLSLVKSG